MKTRIIQILSEDCLRGSSDLSLVSYTGSAQLNASRNRSLKTTAYTSFPVMYAAGEDDLIYLEAGTGLHIPNGDINKECTMKEDTEVT